MIMKTSCELQKKLNKLPDEILVDNIIFVLFITKYHTDDKEINWCIQYRDEADNALLYIQHTSLQAAVDSTLAVIKRINL